MSNNTNDLLSYLLSIVIGSSVSQNEKKDLLSFIITKMIADKAFPVGKNTKITCNVGEGSLLQALIRNDYTDLALQLAKAGAIIEFTEVISYLKKM